MGLMIFIFMIFMILALSAVLVSTLMHENEEEARYNNIYDTMLKKMNDVK